MNFIINSIDVVKFVMDGKMETPTTMFVPLDFLNAVVYPSISKPIEEVYDGMMNSNIEDEKDKGLKGVYELAEAKWLNRPRYGDYKYTKVDIVVLDKLLKGEIKSLVTLLDLSDSQLIKNNYDKTALKYTLLYYSLKNEKTDQISTYIDTIFIED